MIDDKIKSKMEKIKEIESEILELKREKVNITLDTILNLLEDMKIEYWKSNNCFHIYFNRIWRDCDDRQYNFTKEGFERIIVIMVDDKNFIHFSSNSETKYWEKNPKLNISQENYLNDLKNNIIKIKEWNDGRLNTVKKGTEWLLYKEVNINM